MVRRSGLPLLIVAWLLAFGATTGWAGAFEHGMQLFEKEQYKSAAQKFTEALKETPDLVEAYKRLGDSYYNLYSEDHPEYAENAIAAYSKAVKLDPKDGYVRLHFAQVYAWNDDTPNAIKQLKKLLEHEPSSTAAMLELAEIYSWEPATFTQSVEMCAKVLEIEPRSYRAHLTAARVYSWQNAHDRSLSHYESILEQFPNKDKIRMEYANELTMAKRFDDAIIQFNYLTSKDEFRGFSLYGLAEAYYYAKRYRDAATVLKIVLNKSPKNFKALRLQGMVFSEMRKINEAVASFKLAMAIEPEDAELHVFLARAYTMNAATYPKALEEYHKALDKWPDKTEIRAELVRFYVMSNNLTKAIEQLDILIDMDPAEPKFRAELVQVHQKAGNRAEALEQCTALLSLEPDNIDWRLLYAAVLIDNDLFDEAMVVYSGILDDKPNYLPAMIGMGWAHHAYAMYRSRLCDDIENTLKTKRFAVWDRISWMYYRMSLAWHRSRAVALLEKASQKHPDSPEPLMRMAEMYSQDDAWDEAINSYQKAIEVDPNSTDAHLGMAWVYGKMGDKERSIDAIRKAAQIDPTNVDVLSDLGDAYAYQEDVSQAIETLEKALVLQYSDLELHRRLAALYAQKPKYYGKAITECMYILEQDPSDADTRLLLARLYAWTERYDESILLFDRLVEERPNDRDLYLEGIRTKIEGGLTHIVIAELRDTLKEKPDDVDARLALAEAYVANKEYERAEYEYRMVLKREPASAHAHLGLGNVYRETEQYDKAVVEYREVLQSNPDSASAFFGLGVIDRKNAKYERAIKMQKKVLELEPANLHSLAELSYSHYLLSRRYIAHSGQYHRAWWLLSNSWGTLYGVFGEYPDSVVQIRGVLSEDPGNCDLRFALAQELQDNNRKKEAVIEYRKLLRYCPNHIGARIALTDIYSITPSTYSYAIAQTIEIIEREPDNYDAHLRLARLFAWSMRYDQAAHQYYWCIKVRPDNLDVRKELAVMLSYDHRAKEAIDQYRIILAKDPNRDDVRLELGKMLANQNRIPQAIKQYEIILKHDPNHFEASFSLAQLYSWDRKYYGNAVDLYKKLLVHYPSNDDLRKSYGKLLFERGEYEDAEKIFLEAADGGNDNIEMLVMLGRTKIAQRQPEEAIVNFESVVEIQPDHLESHYYLAQLYSGNPDTYDLSVQHGLIVLKYEHSNEDVRELVARVYASSSNYSEAADQYLVLLENKPDDVDYMTAYAVNLSFAERYDEAIPEFEKLIEVEPESFQIRLEYGMALLAQGNYPDAVINIEFAVGERPWDVRARRGLAQAYKGAGRIADSIREYKRILIINPEDQEAKDFLAGYNIEYMEGAFLDEFFDYPGKGAFSQVASTGSEVPAGPVYLDEMDQALINHRIRMAEQMLIRNRTKRARYVYEGLVKKYPNDANLNVALGNIYSSLGMWHAAKKQYKIGLKFDPNRDDALRGLERVKYNSAPRMNVFTGGKVANRETGRQMVGYAGSRFTFRFWNNSEVYGEVAVARYTEESENYINRLSPLVGLRLGLFGEVSLRGEYNYNAYNRLDPSHNYLGAASTNIYDVVNLEGYYIHDDVRQTILAMEQGIGRDNVGGVVQVFPIPRLRFRGEYRHSKMESSDLVDEDTSQLASGSASYTFMDNPWLSVGYAYSLLMFESDQPGIVGAYWAPEQYQNHALPVEVMGIARNNTLNYFAGVIPGYNVVKDEDNGYGVSVYGGFDWEVAIAHQLGLEAASSIGLGSAYSEFSARLNYTYIFGKHSGEWRE